MLRTSDLRVLAAKLLVRLADRLLGSDTNAPADETDALPSGSVCVRSPLAEQMLREANQARPSAPPKGSAPSGSLRDRMRSAR